MALTFISTPHKEGPAVYILGSRMLERRLKPLGEELDSLTRSDIPTVYLDIRSHDGARFADFYDISESSLPAIVVVMADDTIYKMWQGMDLPSPEAIAHEVGRITGNRAV
jgi:hypothetical protein